jgi:hypothetical protein
VAAILKNNKIKMAGKFQFAACEYYIRKTRPHTSDIMNLASVELPYNTTLPKQ